MFLLDTDIISETTKAQPRPAVISWLEAQRADDLFLSIITLGEIAYGIECLPAGEKRDRLALWRATLASTRFAGRIFDVTDNIMCEWARAEARARTTFSRFDALIAATARVHNLVVATRNETDFADFGVRLINPWKL